MSATISLLDANCVRMGRLAALVAEAQQLLGAEDVMDIDLSPEISSNIE